MEFLSKSLKETSEIAFDFASKLEGNKDVATVVGLYGELGSGKTTFMKFLAEALKAEGTVQSPTFVIEKIYNLAPNTFDKIVHIDAYRLDSGEDFKKLGWEKIISDPKNLVCIEWPERIADITPPHTKIFFSHISKNERKIKIES